MSEQGQTEVPIREVQRNTNRCPNNCTYRDGTPRQIRSIINQGVRSIRHEGEAQAKTRTVKITVRVCDGCGEQVSRHEEEL